MNRENRYIVLKRTDVLALTPLQRRALDTICGKVNAYRKSRGAGEIECVVVESDWPEYEPTWQAIARRVDSKCSYCGKELEGDEADNPYADGDGDVICDDCHHEHFEGECSICENSVPNEELAANIGELVVIFRELDDHPAGFYRVKHWPIYADGMITGFVFWDSLEFVAPLDERAARVAKDSGYLAGVICAECRSKIEATIAARKPAILFNCLRCGKQHPTVEACNACEASH